MPELFSGPLYWPLARWLAQLSPQPDAEAVAALAAQNPVLTGSGKPVRFVAPQSDGMAYECRVWECGEVETRRDNWHDWFNALVWLSFPQTKNAITAAHVAAMQPQGELRGRIRDALTHFDECGIVVLSDKPDLLELLREFRWQELFVERRGEVRRHMCFMVFGHATYESLLAPFRGLTAKAVLLDCSAQELLLPVEPLIAAVDCRLAAIFRTERYTRPRDFQPLPLLGIPGVTAESEDPAYYDDTWQFRPGRCNKLTA